MAVAMVFTVVKVNDSKKVAKAGEGSTEVTTPYTDDSYLGTTFGTGIQNDYQTYLMLETMPERNIYVQNNKIQFVLPAISNNTHHVYFDDEKFSVEQSRVKAKYIDFVITDTFSWKNGENTLTHLSNDNTQATLVVTRMYTYEANGELTSEENTNIINNFETSQFIKDFTPDNATNPTSYTKNVITLNYNVSADTKFTVSGNTITDTWTSSETDYYYGENQFVISATDLDGTDETTVGSRNAAGSYNAANINDSANRTTIYPSDGTYYLYHRYVTNIDDGTTGSKVWFTDATYAATVTINDNLVTKVNYWAGTDKPTDESKIFSLFSGDVPLGDNIDKVISADPDEQLTFSTTIDEEGQFVVQEGTKDAENPIEYGTEEVIALNSGNNYTGTKTIPVGTDGGVKYYKFTIRNGSAENATLTHIIELTVNYNDENFSVLELKVDENSTRNNITENTTYFTKNKQVGLFVGLTVGAYTKLKEGNSVGLYTGPYSEATSSLITDGSFGVNLTEGTANLPNYNLSEGDNKFYVRATNFEGDVSELGEYNIFCDTTAPVLDKTDDNDPVTIAQDGYSEATLYTSTKDVTVSFKLKDVYNIDEETVGNGSGVKKDTVKVNYANGEENVSIIANYDSESNTYTATLTSSDITAYAGGGDLEYTITASDIAGNNNTRVFEGVIPFCNNKADITIIKKFDTKQIGESNYADYNNNDKTVGEAKIYYEIQVSSDVDVTNIKVITSSGTASNNKEINDTSDPSLASCLNEGKYIFTTTPQTIIGGKYTVKVEVDNINEYKTVSEQENYFVDITGPDFDLAASTSENVVVNPRTDEHGDADSWVKDVNIVLTNIVDHNGTTTDPEFTDYPVGVDLDAFFAAEDNTGREEIIKAAGAEYDEESSDKNAGMVVFKVTEVDSGFSTVTITVFDKLGNKKEASNKYNIDSKVPVITVPESYSNTVYVSANDISVEATITDNNCISEAKFICVSAPGKTTGYPDKGVTKLKTTTTDGENGFVDADKAWDYTGTYGISLRAICGLGETDVLTPGTYTVEITAKDIAGNSAVKKTLTVLIDADKPVVDIAIKTGSGILTAPEGVTTPDQYTYDNKRGTEAPNKYSYYKYSSSDVTLVFTVTDSFITTSGDDCGITVNNGETKLTDLVWAETTAGSGIWTAEKTFSVDEGKVEEYNITISAVDKASNTHAVEEGEVKNVNFIIDKTPPTVSILLNGGEPEEYYKTGVEVTLEVVENNENSADNSIKYTYTPVGETEPTVTDGDYSSAFTAVGTYVVSASVVDMAGNSTSATPVTFIIDNVDPEIYVSSVTGTASSKTGNGAQYTYNNTYYTNKETNYDKFYRGDSGVTVTFTAFDLGFGESFVEVYDKVDDATDATLITNPTITGEGNEKTISVTVSSEGLHEIYAVATDAAGNEGESGSIVFTYDKTAPELITRFDGSTATDGFRKNGTVKVDYTYTETNWDANDVTLKYTFTPAGGTAQPEVTVNDFISQTFPVEDTGDGTYSITITAIDKAGNTTTDTKSFLIDSKAPEIEIASVSGTAPKMSQFKNEYSTTYCGVPKSFEYGQFYKGSSVNVTINVFDYDVDPTDKTAFIVKDNGTTITSSFSKKQGTDNEYTATVSITGDGYHHVTVEVTDKSQTPGTSNGVEFTIDGTDPKLTLLVNDKEAVNNQRVNGNAKLGYALDDTNPDYKDVKLTGTYKSADGSVQIDLAENLYDKATRTFPDKSKNEGNGVYTITVKAIDKAGNPISKTTTFVIDTAKPELDAKVTTTKSSKADKFKYTYKPAVEGHFTAAKNGYDYGQYYNDSVSIKFTVFDYDIKSYRVVDTYKGEEKDITPEFTSAGNNEYTATITIPKSEEGAHKVVAYATDVSGNTGSSTPITFTIDTTDPTIDLTLNGNPNPESMLRVDDDVTIGYTLEDSNKDLTDVKLTYIFTPAGGAKQAAVTEELFNNSTKKFTANGTYEVKITAIDKAGNSSSDSASFVIDNQKPEIDLKITTSKPAKIDKFKRTYKPAVEGYFTTDKDGYEYGQYYKENVKVKISVFDYDVKDFTVYDNDEKVTPEFKDQGNGLYTAEITVSEEGSHIIKAESVDKSGNTGKSSELSFIIDKTAPALTTTLDGEKYSAIDRFCASDAVVGLKIDEKNNDADDVLRAYVIKPSDHSAEKSDTSYVTALQETYKQNAYYTVTYTVVDRAGNSSTAKIGFTIDNTKPQSDIRITTKAPAKIDKYHNEYSNTNGHFNTSYTYGQYYNESVAMDMAVFDYNVSKIVVTDNDEVIPVTFSGSGDERTASSVTVSDEGEHVVKIIVTDMSGNEAVSKSVSFIIDKSAPGLSATLNNSSSITEQYLQSDASVYLSVSDTNEDEDDVTRIVKMTRPSASAETSEETGALEGNVSYSTEADYEITYTAIDRAGNKSDPITLTFRVDKTAPQLSFSGITRDATAAEDTTITYNMLEDFYWDMTSATVKIYQKVDGMGETPIRTVEITASGASTALSETFKEDGQYRFEFTAQDKAGNQATESFTFILDENAPVIILSGVDGYLTDEDVSFGVQVDETFYLGNNVKLEGTVKTLDDPKGKAIVFDDYSRLTRTASANFEQLFTEDGIYNIKVTSKDIAGNETVQTVQFTIDKTKPLIKDLEELADEEDYKAYTDAVAANDKDAKKLIPIFSNFEFDYEADDIVTDLTTVSYKMYMDGVLYDGLSEIEDGFHTLKITAEDEVGNTTERSFYFILDTVKPGIIVTGVEEDDNLQEPTTITVSLQLTEDSLKSVKLNGEAIAIVNNTATLEVRDKGDYELVIEAVDDAGNESTMTIKFEYGKTSSWLWLLIAGGAALLIAAATFFIILAKKRKKNDK